MDLSTRGRRFGGGHAHVCVVFPGAVGSTDVTNVRWERAPISDAPYYIGKEGYATVAYEVAVDHTGFARGVTAGFPGAKNDKTIIRYDGAIQKLRNDPTYRQLEYNVKDSVGNCNTEKVEVYNMPPEGICHTGTGKVERTSGECTQVCRVFFWQSQGPLQNPQAVTTIFGKEEDR
ncbi:unnamed protein product [Choristocarpus tenellus]